MKISTKGRYALRIMIDIATNCENDYVSIKSISERQNISNKYIEQIISKLLKKNHDLLSSILASIVVPILNTGIFALFTIIFFKPLLAGINPDSMAAALFLGLIGFNFIFEVIVTVIVAPSLYKILLQVNSKNKEID